MPALPRLLHGAVDLLAMCAEDLRRRPPVPFRPAPAAPLACFGPLPPPPPPPRAAGPWRPPAPRPAGAAEGDRLAVHVVEATGTRRGTVVLSPPWKIGSPRLVAGWVRLLARAGWDAWLAVPPHHGERAPAGVRSGEAFASPDLPALRSAVEQSVLELRWLAAIARGRGGEVGLLGLSLGGLSAALAATAPEPVDFAALVAPPADLVHVLSATRIGRRYARLAAGAGAPLPGRAALRGMLAPFRPAARIPTAARLLVALGRYDRVVPPRGPLALARAWGIAPRVHPRGHLTLLFASGAVRRDVAGFLSASPPGTRPGPV
jgi:hypothetical protein